MLKTLKDSLARIRNEVKFKAGYSKFIQTNVTEPWAYMAMRRSFVKTLGKSNDKVSDAINKSVGKYDNIEANGVLGNLTNAEIAQMVEKMRIDGYYIFEKKLPDDVVEEIVKFSLEEPATYLDTATKGYSKETIRFDENKIISPRYQFETVSILKSGALQNLIFDQSLLAFAQEYLGCKPIVDLVAHWWSAPFKGVGKSEAAQMYHFDLDRLKFMKFFFYLTDVTTNTGPHCYARTSHIQLPKALARDGRFEDLEIENVYGTENLIEICGAKGTIIAVDTRGFHKGKDLTEGKRLLFQIEFANSLFGQNYPPTRMCFSKPEFKNLAEKYSHTYKQIFT